MKRLPLVALLAITRALPAQELSDPVVLIVEVADVTTYRGDTGDYTKLGTVPGPTMGISRPFQQGLNIGDIRSVSGQPVKGLWIRTFNPAGQMLPVPVPGQFIADMETSATSQCVFNILLPDGTWVGSLFDRAHDPPGPGHYIVGGGGAFTGVIGEHRLMENLAPQRAAASVSEDPSMRRIHGGGRIRLRFILYPRSRPTVQVNATGPAIFHEDFSQVTAARPARAGEILIVRATGLGPTKPALDPPGARRFSADPLEEVNSPIDVTVNGAQAVVLNKAGWPGETNVYRVDFRVPDGIPAGTGAVRLTAAWIPGPEVTIPVR